MKSISVFKKNKQVEGGPTPNQKFPKSLVAILLVLAFGLVCGAVGYRVGHSRGAKSVKVGNSTAEPIKTADQGAQPPTSTAPTTAQKQFEEYKKQIQSGSAKTDIDKQRVYINGAFAAAAVNAPEAKEYATQAIALMKKAGLTTGDNQKLIDSLQKIADGKYQPGAQQGSQ